MPTIIVNDDVKLLIQRDSDDISDLLQAMSD